MAAPLLLLQNIHVTFGNTALLDGAELSVAAGERLCLVGRNGSGKSTLLKVAAGLIETDDGTRFAQPGSTIRYLPQEPEPVGLCQHPCLCRGGTRAGRRPCPRLLSARQSRTVGRGSAGHAFGRPSAPRGTGPRAGTRPDILLLDEPTNHLDLPAIVWLENELRRHEVGALVLISHDRRFLEDLSRATVWLDRGVTLRLEQGFRRIRGLARRAARRRKRSSGTSTTARSRWKNTGSAMASARGASAIMRPSSPSCAPCARDAANSSRWPAR